MIDNFKFVVTPARDHPLAHNRKWLVMIVWMQLDWQPGRGK